MQYLVTAYDDTDENALDRRMAARKDHLALGDEMSQAGQLHFAAAIMDADGKMIGSSLVVEFSSRAEVDEWLAVEPYVAQHVWKEIEIQPCRVSPSFAH